jgi:hypothetical protein
MINPIPPKIFILSLFLSFRPSPSLSIHLPLFPSISSSCLSSEVLGRMPFLLKMANTSRFMLPTLLMRSLLSASLVLRTALILPLLVLAVIPSLVVLALLVPLTLALLVPLILALDMITLLATLGLILGVPNLGVPTSLKITKAITLRPLLLPTMTAPTLTPSNFSSYAPSMKN